VFFYIPPPDGWEVKFDTEGVEAMAGVCTVIYPDGSMKTVTRDPWELLVTAQGVLADAKKTEADVEAASKSAIDSLHKEALEIHGEFDRRLQDDRESVSLLIDGAADMTEKKVNERFTETFGEMRKAANETKAISKNAAEIVLNAKSDMERAVSDAKSEMSEESARQTANVMSVYKEMLALLEDVRERAELAVNAASCAAQETTLAADKALDDFKRELNEREASVRAMFDEFTSRLAALRQGERRNETVCAGRFETRRRHRRRKDA
jgi:hypothetical protein